jgi:hypothetical protein
MTAAVPERSPRPLSPCLAVAPASGPVISVLFVLTIALFVIGLIAL